MMCFIKWVYTLYGYNISMITMHLSTCSPGIYFVHVCIIYVNNYADLLK